jgi:hypothetical protein
LVGTAFAISLLAARHRQEAGLDKKQGRFSREGIYIVRAAIFI